MTRIIPPAELRRARRLFRDFREKEPGRVLAVPINVPRVVAKIGRIHRLEYFTEHGVKRVLYGHTFRRRSAPDFMVSSDGRQLLLIGGRFVFTWRGIVDK